MNTRIYTHIEFCKNIRNTVQEAEPQSKKPCKGSCWSHWSFQVVQHPVTSQLLRPYPYKTSRMGSRKGLIFQILFHPLRCSGRSASTTTCSGSVDLLEQQATHFIMSSSMYQCSLFVQFLFGLKLDWVYTFVCTSDSLSCTARVMKKCQFLGPGTV